MFKAKAAFTGFAVDDLAKAKKFYSGTLGLDSIDEPMGLSLRLPDGATVFVYQKDDHEPAAFTILNLVVDDIDEAVDELSGQGVQFEHYEGELKTDAKGIMRSQENMGPDIAWFKDPAGNFLSVLKSSTGNKM